MCADFEIDRIKEVSVKGQDKRLLLDSFFFDSRVFYRGEAKSLNVARAIAFQLAYLATQPEWQLLIA